jgi:NAD(P)-dependent dehydrogenase (short-subunit alcohol dehydrogenase family)
VHFLCPSVGAVNKSMSIDLQGQGVSSVLLHPGWVRTDMTRGGGLIDTTECVAGLIGVLESSRPLNGHWWVDARSQRVAKFLGKVDRSHATRSTGTGGSMRAARNGLRVSKRQTDRFHISVM